MGVVCVWLGFSLLFVVYSKLHHPCDLSHFYEGMITQKEHRVLLGNWEKECATCSFIGEQETKRKKYTKINNYKFINYNKIHIVCKIIIKLIFI